MKLTEYCSQDRPFPCKLSEDNFHVWTVWDGLEEALLYL